MNTKKYVMFVEDLKARQEMIDMPGGICVCADCLQKSFNSFQNMGMNINISEDELKELLNMPGIHMMTPEDFRRDIPNKQKPKRKRQRKKKQLLL